MASRCSKKRSANRKLDLVVSDLSPNLSGIEAADQARAVHLGELALEFGRAWLQPGGDLVVKAFQGEGFAEFRRGLEAHFSKVYVRKPKASRDRSREVYFVAKGLKILESRVSLTCECRQKETSRWHETGCVPPERIESNRWRIGGVPSLPSWKRERRPEKMRHKERH